MNNIETELISSEIGYFIRPRNKRKELVEAIVGALIIVAGIALIFWIASVVG